MATSVANPNSPKYTVLMYDGTSPSFAPEPPSQDTGADTLAGAVTLFRAWLRDSGSDHTRSGGHGQPWADVVLTASWDGTSYGDVTGGDAICRLMRGPRGGIVRKNF